MKTMVLASVVAAALASQASFAVTFADLDFSKADNQTPGLVFVPIKNTTINAGVFWYTDLTQKVLPVTTVNRYFRKITLRAYPAVHDSNVYNDYVSVNQALDSRVNLLPADAVVCDSKPELASKLAELNFNYQISSKPGSYPGLCWLEIKYMASAASAEETQLLSYLADHNVLAHHYQVQTPASPAVTLDVPSIVNDLLASTLLQPVVDETEQVIEYTGDFYPVAFATSHYPAHYFRSNAAVDSELTAADWQRFIEQIAVGLTGKVKIPAALAGQVQEIEAEQPGAVVVEVDTRGAVQTTVQRDVSF